jgi:hypothetical protein
MADNSEGHGIVLYDVPLSADDAPIVIQNCTLRERLHGVLIMGRMPQDADRPLSCGHVVIRDNTLLRGGAAVALQGLVRRIHVVGNRILDARYAGIDLEDPLPGTADILVANNTLLRNETAIRVWDDSTKGKDFLKCKNMHPEQPGAAPQLEADLSSRTTSGEPHPESSGRPGGPAEEPGLALRPQLA